MMKRRDFLKTGIAVLSGAALPWKVNFGQVAEAAARSDVWIASGDPVESARALAAAVNLENRIPENGVVLIKPNIGFPTPPQWGATTDPDFLSAILDLCLEAGAKRIIVADHPVGSSPQGNLERSGIGSVCEARDGVQVLMLDQRRFYNTRTVSGKVLKSVNTAKILGKVDLFINLPTAKHHSAAGVSLGLKNLMGLIWDRVPFHQELDLHQAVADLANLIRPQLTFLDCRYALLTNGPAGPGQTEEVGKYLAGFDPVAVDSIGVELAPFAGRISRGMDIPHIRFAAESGLGTTDRDKINLISV